MKSDFHAANIDLNFMSQRMPDMKIMTDGRLARIETGRSEPMETSYLGSPTL